MDNKPEHLERKAAPLCVKGLAAREFDGYGSIFKNVDLGGDIVLPGAFKRSLAQWKGEGQLPGLFWMHDPSRVLGKWLDMKEDAEGLAVKGVLAETDLGNEIHTLLKMDAVRGLSIGYQTTDQDFDKQGNRLIKEAKLWEVSVVSLPMNPLAQVAHVKSRLSAAGEYVPTMRELERVLRKGNISQKAAKIMISKIFDDDAFEPNGRFGAQTRDVETATSSEEEAAVKAANAVLQRLTAEQIRNPFA